MRCRMRCGDIWRCGGPIKKYVPVDSIGIEGRTQEMTFDSQVPPYSVTYSISISPSDATKKDVRIESNNPSIISVDSVESDQVTFTIHNEGDARVRITSLADADISDEYSVSVVTPSEQFVPNNGIFVDVDTEGTATGRKRKTKATAMGDRFTARVFILNEDNPNYVLLEWVHGGDVSKTYVGAANEAHTRAMFTGETTDKLARTIETLWDDGQIANGFVKFTDETWGVVEQFYSTPLTSESIEELQETLAEEEIVTLPETYFDGIEVRCDSKYDDISGGVGNSKNIEWGGIPDASGTHDPIMFEIGDESIVSITDVQIQPEDEQHSERYSGVINFLKKGETTITFYSANNPRGTLKEVHIITTSTGAYYYINLHQDEFPGNVEAGQTTICKAEVEDSRENDTLAASDYDDSIAQITFQRKAGGHEGWLSDWDIHITGLQAGETVARIHSVNDPEVYEDLLITVSEPIPPVPSSCPASLVSVWGDDSTISIGETTAVVTNFTTSADCANVDYSNIVATPSSNIVTTNVDINGRKVYVTGVSAGQCTITFSDGDNSWTFNVTVQAPAVQSIEDFSDAYVLYGETMNVYVDILPLDASYSTGDFNLIFTDGSGNVVQNPPVTADVVSILNVEGHVAGIGIEVIGGQTTGDVYMTVEYTPSQGAISGGGWIHVGPAATALSDIMSLQIRVGEYGSYRIGGLTPSDALTKGITVTSSDDSVISVGSLYNDLGSLLVDLEGLSTGEVTLTITLTNGAEYKKTVIVIEPEPESHTFTINAENLPEGADITGSITDPQSGETLEEISVSSFPMTIDIILGLGLNCNSHEGNGDINIDSADEFDLVKGYEINIGCEGYKPLFEAVGFDLEDGGDGSYYGEVGPGSNVSLTISFTPVE